MQIANNQGIAITRVPSQRQHNPQIVACSGKPARDMYQWLQQANLVEDFLLAAQLEQPVIQLRLFLTKQAGQANGGPYIGQGIVGLAMVDTVGSRQQFQLQAGFAIHLRPVDAFGAQGIRRTHNVDQVPAAVAALPFARIRIEEISIQTITGYFIVETQGVIAGPARTWPGQLRMDAGHELGFAHSLFSQARRCDSGNQAGCRVWQDIVAGLAIEIDRFLDFVQFEIGANSCDLQGAVAARIDTGGFVVVPENTGAHEAMSCTEDGMSLHQRQRALRIWHTLNRPVHDQGQQCRRNCWIPVTA
ncbi:hypothetical protein D3C84_186130 [compost metagenome]